MGGDDSRIKQLQEKQAQQRKIIKDIQERLYSIIEENQKLKDNKILNQKNEYIDTLKSETEAAISQNNQKIKRLQKSKIEMDRMLRDIESKAKKQHQQNIRMKNHLNKITQENEKNITALKNSQKMYEQNIKNLKDQMKKKSFHISQFKKSEQKFFQQYLDSIKFISFQDSIPKPDAQQKDHIVIGNTSVGKSSILNKFFGLKLKTSTLICTKKASKVAWCGKVNIWDSPGDNKEFDFYDPTTLLLFKSTDRVFVLYENDPTNCQNIARIMWQIKLRKIYLVRTKCDNIEHDNNQSADQIKQNDYKFFASIGIEAPILFTSARKDQSFMDNLNLKKLLSGE